MALYSEKGALFEQRRGQTAELLLGRGLEGLDTAGGEREK